METFKEVNDQLIECVYEGRPTKDLLDKFGIEVFDGICKECAHRDCAVHDTVLCTGKIMCCNYFTTIRR